MELNSETIKNVLYLVRYNIENVIDAVKKEETSIFIDLVDANVNIEYTTTDSSYSSDTNTFYFEHILSEPIIAHELAHFACYNLYNEQSVNFDNDKDYLAKPSEVVAHTVECYFGNTETIEKIITKYFVNGLQAEASFILDMIEQENPQLYKEYSQQKSGKSIPVIIVGSEVDDDDLDDDFFSDNDTYYLSGRDAENDDNSKMEENQISWSNAERDMGKGDEKDDNFYDIVIELSACDGKRNKEDLLEELNTFWIVKDEKVKDLKITTYRNIDVLKYKYDDGVVYQKLMFEDGEWMISFIYLGPIYDMSLLEQKTILTESDTSSIFNTPDKKALCKIIEKFVEIALKDTYRDDVKLDLMPEGVCISKYGTKMFQLSGGLNGPGVWENYFNNLADFVVRLGDLLKTIYGDTAKVWLVNIYNDCCDDVFYPVFGVGLGEKVDPTESIEWQEENTWQANEEGEKIPFEYDKCTDDWYK